MHVSSVFTRCTSIAGRSCFVGSVVLIATTVIAGCDDPDLLRQLGAHSAYGQSAGAGGAGSGSGGADSSSVGGAGGAAMDGGGEVSICSAFELSPSFQLAPSAPGQNYVRCQTLGPEVYWPAIAIAADGRHVAARTDSGTVRLMATNPWREVAQIASPLGVLDAAEFTPDGQALAVLSAEMGEITLWNASDGTLIAAYAAPPASTIAGTASSLAYSSDGKRLATSLEAVIDSAGAVTSWKTGAPITTSLVVNPENLDLGEAIPRMTFTAGDTTLLVDTAYQIGDSPPSTRLELRVVATGQQTVLFDMYSRALSGFALSADRRVLAMAIAQEGSIAGFTPGLAIRDAVSGALIVSDPGFTGSVLGFSKDGQQLFTQTDSMVSVLSTGDLHTFNQFSWPAGTVFLGVSPAGNLVGSNLGGSTTWFDTKSGAPIRSFAYSLQQIVWTPDGRFGAGIGDAASLFHVWHEPDGVELCAPGLRDPPAPPLSELGTFDDPDQTPTATSDDGSIAITNPIAIHTHAADWTALRVNAAVDGSLLRVFGATGGGARRIAISQPSGDRLYTAQGPNVAVWCR